MSKQGTPVWYELTTTDFAGCKELLFRSSGMVSGRAAWQVSTIRLPAPTKRWWRRMWKPPQPGIPPNWAIYFAVDDCDAAAKAAEVAGGKVCAGPMDIPQVGRFAALSDPQGAMFIVKEKAATVRRLTR